MNPCESRLDLHENNKLNLMCAPISPDLLDLTLLDPGSEEIRYGNGNFNGSVLVPAARGSLESLVAQGFGSRNHHNKQPPSSVLYSSPEADMSSSVPLQGVHTNMVDGMSFTDNIKSSVPLMPASHLNNNLANTASSSRYVNHTCYQGKAKRRGNKSKDPSAMLAKQRSEALRNQERSKSINSSLNALLTMSGTSTYKTSTASMLEGVTNHMKLLHLQSKMANIMNIAPRDVTLVIQHYFKTSMQPNLNSGNVVRAMRMNNENAAGKGPVDAGTISTTPAMAITKMSIVHPTTYLCDPVIARTCAPTIDPIVAYVIAAGKTELPSTDEVAELIASFERLQQTLDYNQKS